MEENTLKLVSDHLIKAHCILPQKARLPVTILDVKVGIYHVMFTCLLLKKKILDKPSVLGLISFEIFHYCDYYQQSHHYHYLYYLGGMETQTLSI